MDRTTADRTTAAFPELPAVRSLPQAPQAEEEMLRFWKERDIFRRSVEERPPERRFVFFEGPPTANASPGVHHAISRLMKDLFCRYWTMKGFRVTRKAGWDTHGLPVEIEVEKKLGLEGKEQIEAYGIGRFNEACRQNVFTYEQEWRRFTERGGFWLDLDNRYATLDNSYIESVWAILDNFWRRELIYRGHKVVPYCPRCGTPLSSHEVSQGYRDVADPSVYVRFPLRAAGTAGTAPPRRSLLVWTTTPWTLISNVAVAVNPEETYAVVRTGQDAAAAEELVLAEARREEVLAATPHEVVERVPGTSLVGARYEAPFDFLSLPAGVHRVIAADFVTLGEGTGLVHIAPAFGEDDFRAAQAEGLPVARPVDARGRFTTEVTPWAGKEVKKADAAILKDLKARGLLLRAETVTHSYPHCWRCGHYLIYYAREGWFLRTTQFRDEMLAENARIRWVPEEIGAGRFGRWLEGNVDWALSRDRYWGTPLNFWRCAGCERWTSVGSLAELTRLAGGALPGPADLHRPWVDELRLACPHCGGALARTPEVLDCWFDSGSMPYAQWGYPVAGEREFAGHFPADFIAEAVDQTRGWFYSLLAIGTLYQGRSAYKSCLVSDLILDERGRKMSKSQGNTVSPWKIFDSWGADALRWYLAAVNPPWVPTRFSERGVGEYAQKLLGTFRSSCGFFSTYAAIDRPDPGGWDAPPRARHPLDRWILSRLETTVEEVGAELDGYELTRAARRLQEFVLEELSNWYIRRSRRRFWRHGPGSDKAEAYHTLFWTLRRTAELLAPFVPFASEEAWQRIVRPLAPGAPESVHLAEFPRAVTGLRDAEAESDMARLIAVVELGRAARAKRNLKVRQPLSVLTARLSGEGAAASAARLASLAFIVEEELNVRRAVFETGAPETVADGDDSAAAADGGVGVLLDTRITPELRDEGLARELVNKIQFMRKKGGFQVTDRVSIALAGSDALLAAARAHEAFIRDETLATALEYGEARGEVQQEWDVNGEHASIGLTRAE